MKIKRTFFKMVFDIRDKLRVFLSACVEKYCKPPIIRNTEDTIEKLLKSNVSMSRFGDGELSLANGYSIRYQKADKKLKKRLREILKSENENCIICVSDVFGDMNERSDENREYWEQFVKKMRWNTYRLLDMRKTYYNTTATRVYKPIKDKSLAAPRFARWKKIWNDKDIVFIEGAKTRMGVGNDLFSNAKSIKRIIGPAENAFERYDEIFNFALTLDKDVLFILALGPCATVMSYDLAQAGYRALDLGHIDVEYEWYLRGDSEIALGNKYVNEVSGGNQVCDTEDEEYIDSIIFSVK